MVMLDAERLASTVAPAQRRQRRWRHRDPEILADLRMNDEAGKVFRREQLIRPEGGDLAADFYRAAFGALARSEVAALVEFPVVRDMDLRNDAEKPAAMRCYRAVVDAAAVAERGAEKDERQEPVDSRDDIGDRVLDLVEQRILQQEVVDRVAGQRRAPGSTTTAAPRRSHARAARRIASALAAGSATRNARRAGRARVRNRAGRWS